MGQWPCCGWQGTRGQKYCSQGSKGAATQHTSRWPIWDRLLTIFHALLFCLAHSHSGAPDQIMEEIPTVVVQPMPASVVPHADYVVLNRPYAVSVAGDQAGRANGSSAAKTIPLVVLLRLLSSFCGSARRKSLRSMS